MKKDRCMVKEALREDLQDNLKDLLTVSIKGTVLVVDDNLDFLRLMAAILSEAGYTVLKASGGSQALAVIKDEHPDLVLLDIMMPEIDGYEVCRRLKTNSETRDIPVIFLSARQQVKDKVKAFNTGGVDFIVKPFHAEELLARVHSHLSLQEMRNRMQRQYEHFDREIGMRIQAEETLQVHIRQLAMLNYLSQYLQACREEEDTYPVVTRVCRQIFPASSGYLYIQDPGTGSFEPVESWGEPPEAQKTITAEENPFAGTVSGDDTSTGIIMEESANKEWIYISIGAPEELLVFIAFYIKRRGEYNNHQGIPSCLISKNMILARVLENYILSLQNLRLRETLRKESICDPLTGLYNRRHLEAVIERETNQAKEGGKTVGIIMCDIDHFKQFNDTYGHEAGDHILHELGNVFRGFFRDEDIACRYGGEEFLMVIPDVTHEAVQKRGEELLKKVREMKISFRGKIFTITVSVGVAFFSGDGNIQDVITAADSALYEAKESGRNRVVFV
ncbi:MAG: diguanylate cyclase [bacterium]|nr:diguanylate cyclase [bacterium]